MEWALYRVAGGRLVVRLAFGSNRFSTAFLVSLAFFESPILTNV